ncbi:MAG: hypothetical protein RL514_3705 [Verrucomicrobiota bacterium]|jgi:hypothetical protein
MKLTDVDQYMAMRASLTQEKATLETRLAAINRALDGSPGPAAAKPGPKPEPKLAAKPGARRGPRAKNSMTMKEAMTQALGDKALGRKELLEAVQKLGYKFSAKDALSSISTVLYTDKSFKNTDGKFSVGK